MGNTFVRLVGILMVKDHPHIHGEYQTDVAPADNNQGSPPHTWGIPDEYEIRKDGDRITPTYMGNTSAVWPDCLAIWDHPHIHGEYATTSKRKWCLTGSPPHTWGIPCMAMYPDANTRITPTYMGNTQLKRSFIAIFEDHPHIHGEYVNRSLYDAFFRSLVCHF